MGLNLSGSKRKYEKKLRAGLARHEEFLIAHLRKEWEAMEQSARRARRKEQFLDMTKKGGRALGLTVLALLALGGVLTLAVIAPNIFAGFGRMRKYRGYFDKKELRSGIGYLRRRNYITVTEKHKDGFPKTVKLTPLGKEQVLRRAFGELKITSDKWDGLWRMVIFDIPNRHKGAREDFREKLKGIGFYSLQKSVFVYPYQCREEIEFLASFYNIGSYIRFIETDKISSDGDLKGYFFLRKL